MFWLRGDRANADARASVVCDRQSNERSSVWSVSSRGEFLRGPSLPPHSAFTYTCLQL